jgi:hypothetical protein
LAVLVLALSVGVAFAQETTSGSITGKVVDAQGLVLPGVTVTITSSQGTKTFVTDSTGRFFAPYLTPGTYTVTFQLQGFSTVVKDDIAVRLGQRIEVPATMQVGKVSENVTVKAGAPVVNTSSTTVGTNLDTSELNRLPVARTFTSALYLAPGVSTSGGAGHANPSISGGSGLENEYVVDGINTTNVGYGAVGSYSIVFGSLGTGVPFDFLKEIQVKTGGFDAEYGEATGGVVNVVTKSGSNLFRGSLFGYTRPSALEGTFTPIKTINATRPEAVNTVSTTDGDGGIELGGPVLHNKLFFFGAVDPQYQRTTLVAPKGFPLASMGNVNRNRRVTPYAAKATWQLTSTQRIDASFFGDPSHGDTGPQRRTSLLNTTTSAFSSLDYGGNNQTVKYEGVLTPSWLVEASVSRAANSITETPSVDAWRVTDTRVTPNIRTGGVGYYEVGNNGVNLQYDVKSTNIFDWAGNHQIRYGLGFEDISYDNTFNYSGPTFTLPDGTQTATGATVNILADPVYGQIYRVTRAGITNLANTRQHYLDFFVEDTYQIGNHLTIKPGIRYEQQRLIGNQESFTWKNNWAPRIGAIYDPTGTGRMKIFGNFGRFYAKVPNDLAARAMSAEPSVSLVDYFDPQLTQPVPNGVLAAGATSHYVTNALSATTIDPNSKSSYLDEWVGGFQYELGNDWALGVSYTRRRFGRILEDVGTLPMVDYYLGNVPGANSVEYFLTNPGPNTPVVGTQGYPISFENAIHDYDAVEVTANKHFSHNWALQASYRWSRLYGTYEGFYRNDNGQSDPAITSLDDFPTNDPTYTAIGTPMFGFQGDIRYLGALGAGPLPEDIPNQVKVYGNYDFDMGLNLGAGLVVSQGTPLTALAANPVYDNAGEIPTTPRGAGFTTVDGFKTRTPVLSTVDFHAGYPLKLGGDRRLVLMADVFNLFNRQTVTAYDNFTQSSFDVSNPDFGKIIAYQLPIEVRFGARFQF